jgi:hypothetical protein
MSFADFERAIASPALKQIADHWNAARAGRWMPGWSDIKPASIAAHLPIVRAYKYDVDGDTFTGRLSGEKIARIFGKNLGGLPMREIYAPHDYPRLFGRAKRVVREPAFYRGHGMVFWHIDRHGIGERSMLPLAADWIVGDGLLGATEYENRFMDSALEQPETDEWFGLD